MRQANSQAESGSPRADGVAAEGIAPDAPNAGGDAGGGTHLERRLGLVQATALNMVNMVGAGPFITIPLLMAAMGGPQSLLGWVAAVLITIPDGLIWSELGAALPGSGGTYVYLREAYGRFGRFMAFLFIWQFILSGPLEIASGYIGFGQYFSYLAPNLPAEATALVAAGAGLLNMALLFRGIRSVGAMTVVMWIAMLMTVGAVIVTGAMHFDPHVAFDFPPGAFSVSWGFLLGLGTAARIGIYDYLGYYDVCFVAEEVREPGRVIPRAVITSLVGVAAIYFTINLSIIGSVPWRSFVGDGADPRLANYLASVLIERYWGVRAASVFTVFVLVTIYAGTFALLLGYSRIPYAAARAGDFFRVFARLHPRHPFPWVSLLAVGTLSVAACFLKLGTVIEALLATRILVQFIAQVGAVMLLRRTKPELKRPFRIWFYPVPCFVALAGWVFLYATAGGVLMAYSLLVIVAGCVAYGAWRRVGVRGA